MKILSFVVSASVIAVFLTGTPVIGSVSKEVAHASKDNAFSKNGTHTAPLAPKYQRFATLLAQYNNQYGTQPIVQKGERRSVAARPVAYASPYIATVQPNAILPVFNQPDIKARHQEIANEAMRRLPERCWDTLQSFYVRYDNPESRGLAGATTMILSGNVPDIEFRALFMHEIGHVFDLNNNLDCLGGSIESGLSEFKDGKKPIYQNDASLQFYRISWQNELTMRAGAQKDDFVSGYASSDCFEDFAESHTFFVLHNEKFRELALQNTVLAQKYNFFIAYLYPQGIQIAVSDHSNDSKRPWDITKLPYQWL